MRTQNKMHTMCTPHNPHANPKSNKHCKYNQYITTTLPQTQTIRKPRKTNAETLLHTHNEGSVTAGSCSSPTLGRLQQLCSSSTQLCSSLTLGRLQQLPLRECRSLMTEEGECGRKTNAYHVHTPQPSRKSKIK